MGKGRTVGLAELLLSVAMGVVVWIMERQFNKAIKRRQAKSAQRGQPGNRVS